MGYSRNFGMRSFENIVRNGRFRTPVGSAFEIGSPVQIDPAKPGFMKQAAAGAARGPQSGLVLFEHIQAPGLDPALSTASDLHTVPGGRYAQIVHGAGAKVWFKNTGSRVLYDGRSLAGGALLADSVDVTALKPGDGLVPAANGQLATGTGADVWLVIEQANPSTGLVEARFTF